MIWAAMSAIREIQNCQSCVIGTYLQVHIYVKMYTNVCMHVGIVGKHWVHTVFIKCTLYNSILHAGNC